MSRRLLGKVDLVSAVISAHVSALDTMMTNPFDDDDDEDEKVQLPDPFDMSALPPPPPPPPGR